MVPDERREDPIGYEGVRLPLETVRVVGSKQSAVWVLGSAAAKRVVLPLGVNGGREGYLRPPQPCGPIGVEKSDRAPWSGRRSAVQRQEQDVQTGVDVGSRPRCSEWSLLGAQRHERARSRAVGHDLCPLGSPWPLR